MILKKNLLLLLLLIGASDFLKASSFKTNQNQTSWDKAKNWVIAGSVIAGSMLLAISTYFANEKFQKIQRRNLWLKPNQQELEHPVAVQLDEMYKAGVLNTKDFTKMLDVKLNVNAPTRAGGNMLLALIGMRSNPHYTAKDRQLFLELAKILADKGIDINFISPQGTALRVAINNEDVDMVKFILARHPNATQTDLDLANEKVSAYKHLNELNEKRKQVNEIAARIFSI